MTSTLLTGIAELTTFATDGPDALERAALVMEGSTIAWVGPAGAAPDADERVDLGGRAVLPGFVDSHSHLVFAGDRSAEFTARMAGEPYAAGGIRTTVAATRAATDEQLTAHVARLVHEMRRQGTTTVEIKSGYGLDLATEAKMLRVAGRLSHDSGIRVRRSFLGAHAVPAEDRDHPDRYLDRVVEEMLPAIARDRLADAVDAFGEKIAFSPAQVERVFRAAQALGLPVKLHADQLSDQDGAALAARFGALSADHLEYTSESGAMAMGRAGTVAVLLPGAYYFLRETQLPPVAAFRRHGVPIALATDNNPGTSPATSLLLMLNMGCTLFRLTPEEALAGVTRNAARALGLAQECGRLAVGLAADFVFWDVADPAELSYRIAFNPCRGVIRAGQPV
jgi:imidazolonepropionase